MGAIHSKDCREKLVTYKDLARYKDILDLTAHIWWDMNRSVLSAHLAHINLETL